jgi:predicted nucleic acid-binding protein
MSLENLTRKQANDLEINVTALLGLMRKAKVQNPELMESLKTFEQELGELRRKRFDATNSEYGSY